jgi:hypothetical protein
MTMPDNEDIRAALQGLTTNEPPLGFGAAEVVTSGRRRQFRRHGMVAGVASIAAAVAVTVPLTLLGGQHVSGAGSGGPAPAAPTVSSRSVTTNPPTPVPATTAPPTCDATPTPPSPPPTESNSPLPPGTPTATESPVSVSPPGQPSTTDDTTPLQATTPPQATTPSPTSSPTDIPSNATTISPRQFPPPPVSSCMIGGK